MVIVKLLGAADAPAPSPLGPFKWVRVINGVAYGVRPDAKFADELGTVNPDGTWALGGGGSVTPAPINADRDDLTALYEDRRQAGLDIWTGRKLGGDELPPKERPVGALTAMLRKVMAASRKTAFEDESDEDQDQD
jgi:hypothetical protein